MPFLGETCALLTAVCWTASSTAFALASRRVGPLPANHFRLLAALPVLVVACLVATGEPWPASASAPQLAAMAGSGVIGLVLGDVGYFYALAKIGPRLCSVVLASWPAFTVAIEAALGRVPPPVVLLGIALLSGGVGLVLLRNRDAVAWNPSVTRGQRALGVLGALLGALGQAGGFVLAGRGLAAAAGEVPTAPIACTVVRMAAAVAVFQGIAALHRRPFALGVVLRDGAALRAAAVGACFGPVGGVWLSMVARAEAGAAGDAGIASALMSTTPIFMMPVAAVLYRAPIGRLGVAGTLLAVVGAGVCLASR
jgi:drug/metabolite transporter (DMT)-like permease